MNLRDFEFIKILEEHGKVYQVGGAVRDKIIGVKAKDLDLLVTKIPVDKIKDLISHLGYVDLVGRSYGVLKFKDKTLGEIDITIPRTERLMTEDEESTFFKTNKYFPNSHQRFVITSDHEMPIEHDLERRDFTINSIAMDLDCNIIDPFRGLKDIGSRLLRMTNKKAFNDDPLRMMRAIRFHSVLGFGVEDETFNYILKNNSSIKTIARERILEELIKIHKKGDVNLGLQGLVKTGLWDQIFTFKPQLSLPKDLVHQAEFFYMLLLNDTRPEDYYFQHLSGDRETQKAIWALRYYSERIHAATTDFQIRKLLVDSYKIHKIIASTTLHSSYIKNVIIPMFDSKYPWALSDLKINGDDLLERGFTGKQIGDILRSLLEDILDDKLINVRGQLLERVNAYQI